MKGLLIKDILLLRSYSKTIGFLIILYFILGLVGNNSYFFSGMSGVLCVMMVATSFSYDNYAKWDRYGASLPVRRSEMVGAKYLLALILIVVGIFITLFMSFAFALVHKSDADQIFSMIIGTTAASIFMVSVLLPCIYKFGAEKGRLALVVAAIVVAIAAAPIIALLALVIPENDELSFVKDLIKYILPIVEVIIFYLSYKLSCRIYSKKEL